MQKLSDFYRELTLPDGEDNIALADKIAEESIVCFLEAKMLIGIPYSEDIMAVLLQDEQFSREKWNELIKEDEERLKKGINRKVIMKTCCCGLKEKLEVIW